MTANLIKKVIDKCTPKPKAENISDYMVLEEYKGENQLKGSTLHELYKNHQGHLSGKWEQYLSIYSRMLAPFILEDKPVNLLEIGVSKGGSLEIWQKLLPKDSKIWGVDVIPECLEIKYSGNVKVLLGDISKGELVNNEFKDEKFDIIIDDASHFSSNVIANFENMFEKLKYGGLYIIEDTHTSYWEYWEGGYKKKTSTMEYFKNLCDSINYVYFKKNASLNKEETKLYSKYNPQIASISFYDSVIIIEKYLQEKKQPFKNYLCGNTGDLIAKDVLLNHGHLECSENTAFEKFYRI